MNRSTAVFRCYLAFCAVGLGGYFLLPQSAQNVALIASNLICLTAILFAWRTRQLTPASGWLLLAAFPAATALGNTDLFRERQHSAYRSISQLRAMRPSSADMFSWRRGCCASSRPARRSGTSPRFWIPRSSPSGSRRPRGCSSWRPSCTTPDRRCWSGSQCSAIRWLMSWFWPWRRGSSWRRDGPRRFSSGWPEPWWSCWRPTPSTPS